MWDFYSILVNTEELWEYSRIPQIMLGASWRHLGHTWNPPENTYRSSGSTLAFLWAHRLALERPLGRSGKHLEQPREHWGAPGETTARLRCLEYTRDPCWGSACSTDRRPAGGSRAAALSGGARTAPRHFQQCPGSRLCCAAAGCADRQRERIHIDGYPLHRVAQYSAPRAHYCTIRCPACCLFFSFQPFPHFPQLLSLLCLIIPITFLCIAQEFHFLREHQILKHCHSC